jgi:hypothetical protein
MSAMNNYYYTTGILTRDASSSLDALESRRCRPIRHFPPLLLRLWLPDLDSWRHLEAEAFGYLDQVEGFYGKDGGEDVGCVVFEV